MWKHYIVCRRKEKLPQQKITSGKATNKHLADDPFELKNKGFPE